MADDPYSMLGILSPEAEEVSRTLNSGRQSSPSYVPSKYQPVADYHARAEEAMADRERLALEAEVQRRLVLPTVSGQRARGEAWRMNLEQAMYEKQAKALLDDLGLLDPADPEALDQQDEVVAKHPIARKAMSDPRVANLIRRQSKEHEEMRKVFDDDPDALAEYTRLRADGLPPKAVRQQVLNDSKRRAERLWFASNGGNPDDFDSGKFNGPDGKPDKAKMAYYLASQKKEDDRMLSTSERKALDQAAENFDAVSGLDPDDEETKRREFMAKFGRPPKNDQEWTSARNMVLQAGLAEKEALAALILDFERAGKRVPDLYRKMVGVQSTTPTEASGENVPRGSVEQPSGPPKPVMVRTKAEYDALPSGSRYMDSNGKIGVKK